MNGVDAVTEARIADRLCVFRKNIKRNFLKRMLTKISEYIRIWSLSKRSIAWIERKCLRSRVKIQFKIDAPYKTCIAVDMHQIVDDGRSIAERLLKQDPIFCSIQDTGDGWATLSEDGVATVTLFFKAAKWGE